MVEEIMEYNQEAWYLAEKAYYIAEYGDIPPPWVIFPDTHPYSMLWRMGAGDTFTTVFHTWFEENFTKEQNKIDFFLKYPPPARWLGSMTLTIWEDLPFEAVYAGEYLEKIKKLGFLHTESFLTDLDDPRWLDE